VQYIAQDAAGLSALSWQSKFSCLFTRQRIAGENCLLVIPQKFMNLSGEAVAPLLNFFKIDVEDVIVLYDELDLSPGAMKLKKGGSAAGHNGIKDLCRHIGDGFIRVRIGIGHPRDHVAAILEEKGAVMSGGKRGTKVDVSSWVLSRPGPDDKELIQKAVSLTGGVVKVLIEDGLKAAQNRFHLK
jgi:PTH1 family peptidyl-tRNA hydrolase